MDDNLTLVIEVREGEQLIVNIDGKKVSGQINDEWSGESWPLKQVKRYKLCGYPYVQLKAVEEEVVER